MEYIVKVPATKDQGSFELLVRDSYRSKSEDALQDYNSARYHDGQPALKRMPKGTKYTPLYLWVIQQYVEGQWEDVSQFYLRSSALICVKEYRDNQPQYAARLKKIAMDRDEAVFFFNNRARIAELDR